MRARVPEHEFTVSVGGVDIDGFTSARVESDILTPGDGFTVSGKDRVARMVAESAPLDIDFQDRDLVDVATELARPWFGRVVLSNAQNRDLLRGRGKKARASGKPLLNPGTDERRVSPGTSKWEALDELLHRAGYLAWSSATGRELIIARPDHDQEANFAFYATRYGSNCKNIQYHESNESRYAVIVTVGTGHGDDVNHAVNTLGRYGVARDADTFNGVGAHFLHQKRLVLPVEARTVKECQRLAERERAERDAVSFEVTITAWGFGAVVPPASAATLYAPDIVVSALSENTPVDGAYYVTARTFVLSRNEEHTTLRCVPLGVAL